MRVRKISPEWQPSENKSLQVGEIIDISTPRTLVEQGMAIYVDDDGDDWEKFPIAWDFRPKTKEQKEREKAEQNRIKELEDALKLTPAEREKARLEAVKVMKQEQARKMLEAKAKKKAMIDAQREIKKQEEKAQEALEKAIQIINEKPL